MSTFLSLSKITEDKITNLFNQKGAFFAFSKSQFEEAKKPGIEYSTLPSGLICPKENVEALLKEFEEIHSQGIKEQVETFGAERIIESEYFNHETQISGDNQQIVDLFESYRELYPEQFTIEIIESVCAKCFQKAIDNDWF